MENDICVRIKVIGLNNNKKIKTGNYNVLLKKSMAVQLRLVCDLDYDKLTIWVICAD